MRKINLNKEDVCKEYLKEGENIHSLAKKFNCSISPISRILKESNDQKIIDKLNGYKTRKKINKIRVGNNHIYVLPTNSDKEHIFDYSEILLKELMKHHWWEADKGHLRTVITTNGESKGFQAYWLVIGEPNTGIKVDHIDTNQRNNKSNNLRFATSQQNAINKKPQKNNKTGFSGVSYIENKGKYRAYIKHNQKQISLGSSFDTANDAYIARAKKEIELFGEFANIHEDYKYLIEEYNNNE